MIALTLLACAAGTLKTDTADTAAVRVMDPPTPRLIVLATCEGVPSIGDDLEDYEPTGWYAEITEAGVMLYLDAELTLDPDGLVGLWRCEEDAAGGYVLYCGPGWSQDGESWNCPPESFQPTDFDGPL